MTSSTTIAVVGLGYVGLPLAVEFGKQYHDDRLRSVAGQDRRVPPRRRSDRRGERRRARRGERARGHDRSGAARSAPTSSSSPCRRRSTTRISRISARCSAPANRSAGICKRGAIVVFESTVYPGATEEICVPVLERHSGMTVEARFLRRLLARAHQSRRPGAYADAHHEGRLGRHAGNARARRGDLRQRRQGRRASRVVDQGRRSGQGDREHAARPQHRADERAGAHLPQDRHRHDRSAGGRGHEVELPAVPAGPRRRPLHRRRSVLPDAQGRHARLPPAGHPRGPPHQRRHGQVRRRADGQADDPGRLSGQGGEGQRARPDVQGKLPGPAQLARHRRDQRAALVRRRRARARSGGRRRRGACTSTASTLDAVGAPAARASRSSLAVAHREFNARPVDDFVDKLEPGGLFVDVKCQADAAALRARGVSVWRL